MKIFAVTDEFDPQAVTTYLIYYEASRTFYIEILDGADEWSVPFYLSAFARKKQYTVNSKYSRLWVRQRIIPPDRQNIGQILRDNRLKSYDEFGLLMLGEGRCAQDDFCLTPIREQELPECILERRKKRIDEVIPLSESFSALVFFSDASVRLCELGGLIDRNPALKSLLTQFPDRFPNFGIEAGGYGISWNENMILSYPELYDAGKPLPITKKDLTDFLRERVINTSEAAEMLGCSRQNIADAVKRERLIPVKKTAKDTLFLKSDVLKNRAEP